jgi:hypothetical protein
MGTMFISLLFAREEGYFIARRVSENILRTATDYPLVCFSALSLSGHNLCPDSSAFPILRGEVSFD